MKLECQNLALKFENFLLKQLFPKYKFENWANIFNTNFFNIKIFFALKNIRVKMF